MAKSKSDESNFQQVNKRLDDIAGMLQTLTSEVISLTRNNKDSFQNINKKIEQLDRNMRRMNVVIFGLESTSGKERYEDLLSLVCDLIRNGLGLAINMQQIAFVTRIGSRAINSPILVQLSNYSIKLSILQNSKKLRGQNIRFSEDYTIQQREVRRALIPHMIAARTQGHTAQLKGVNLFIDNKLWNSERLEGVSAKSESELPTTNSICSKNALNSYSQTAMTTTKISSAKVQHRYEASLAHSVPIATSSAGVATRVLSSASHQTLTEPSLHNLRQRKLTRTQFSTHTPHVNGLRKLPPKKKNGTGSHISRDVTAADGGDATPSFSSTSTPRIPKGKIAVNHVTTPTDLKNADTMDDCSSGPHSILNIPTYN